MPPVPPFLERLGLTPAAGAREIRRAYARELKRIDLERDPEAFQALRQAYDLALRWAAERAEEGDGASSGEVGRPLPAATDGGGAGPRGLDAAAAPPAAGPAPATTAVVAAAQGDPPDPEALAEAVWGEVEARLIALEGEAAAEELLARALADPRLLGLEARERFEARLAERLAQGWQPGHEQILPVAIRSFGWQHDRRRLEGLGAPGRTLDAAILEGLLLETTEGDARIRQCREVVAYLRTRSDPGPDVLYRLTSAMESLAARYPSWLRLIAPWSAVDEWRSWSRKAASRYAAPVAPVERVERVEPPPSTTRSTPRHPPRSPARRTSSLIGAIAVLGLAMLSVLAATQDEAGHAPAGRGGAAAGHVFLLSNPGAESRCREGEAAACVEQARLERDGVFPAPERAAISFGRACELGSAEGCTALADMLRAARGVQADPIRARALDERACALGDAKACDAPRR